MKTIIHLLLFALWAPYQAKCQVDTRDEKENHRLIVKSKKTQNNVVIGNSNQAVGTQLSFSSSDIVYNDIANYHSTTSSFEILMDGMYEVSAVFYFNPNRKEKDYVRFGINFMILKNAPLHASRTAIPNHIIAGTRFSFNQDNSNQLNRIELPPVIVSLKACDIIKAYVAAGNLDVFVDKGQFSADIEQQLPYSKILEIKKIEL